MQTSGNPVARAHVVLQARFAGEDDAVPVARAETDWNGTFVLDGIPAAHEAWVEVNALYYLAQREPPFSIRGGEDLDCGAVILHFGGSIHGEVLGENGRRLPHTEVFLTPLGSTDAPAALSSWTDTRGVFLLSGIGTGQYTLQARTDSGVAATIPGVWVQADTPTLQIRLHLDGRGLRVRGEQDPQRLRAYRAETLLSNESRGFESLEEIQAYLDGMIASAWWSYEFPAIETIRVEMGKEENDPARGGAEFIWDEAVESWATRASGSIELPRWAWRELPVLHEVSHVLSPGSHHGQLFARTLHRLVTKMLGDDAAFELTLAYSAEGVSW